MSKRGKSSSKWLKEYESVFLSTAKKKFCLVWLYMLISRVRKDKYGLMLTSYSCFSVANGSFKTFSRNSNHCFFIATLNDAYGSSYMIKREKSCSNRAKKISFTFSSVSDLLSCLAIAFWAAKISFAALLYFQMSTYRFLSMICVPEM